MPPRNLSPLCWGPAQPLCKAPAGQELLSDARGLPRLCCQAGPDVLSRCHGGGLRVCPGGIAKGQPGLLLSPSLGSSALVQLVWLVVNAGGLAEAPPDGNLFCDLPWAWGHSAAAADLAHSSCVQNLTPKHLPSHQPR